MIEGLRQIGRKNIVEIIGLLFILLFMYAAISKLIDIDKFRIQLGQSPLLTRFASWLVWVIPFFEILICALMFFQKFRLIALYACFSLMIMFTTYIIFILQFSDFIPCSCGGILQSMNWVEHLIFNAAFVILGAFGILLYPKK